MSITILLRHALEKGQNSVAQILYSDATCAFAKKVKHKLPIHGIQTIHKPVWLVLLEYPVYYFFWSHSASCQSLYVLTYMQYFSFEISSTNRKFSNIALKTVHFFKTIKLATTPSQERQSSLSDTNVYAPVNWQYI